MHDRQSLVIRPARASDVRAVLELWTAAGAVPSATDDAASIERLRDRDADALLVAEAGGRVVGSLVAVWDGWRGNMYRLAVDPAFRRRGIGRALVDAGARRLRSFGAPV